MTTDQKARMNRVIVNGAIVVGAASITSLAQFLSQQDFGTWGVYVVAVMSMVIKTVQAWAEPVQNVYLPK